MPCGGVAGRCRRNAVPAPTGPLAAIGAIPLDYAGYGIVGLFVAAWIVAIAIWKIGRVEERWSTNLAANGPAR